MPSLLSHHQAELKGGVALDRLIEDAMEVEADHELKQLSTMLPPIAGPRSEPTSPAGMGSRAAANALRRTSSPMKTTANRCGQKRSDAGALLQAGEEAGAGGNGC